MAGYRSQGGPFHIVQMSKKRQNSNCKYYEDGKCIKSNRVCEIGDTCYSYSPIYQKENPVKEQKPKRNKSSTETPSKKLCKYCDKTGYCSYLEKKCASSEKCISFRPKEIVEESASQEPIKREKNKFLTAQLWIYTYKSGKSFKDICLLSSEYDNYVIDNVECLYSYQFAYFNKIKRCEDIFLHGLNYKFVSRQLKYVTLILNSVAKSSFRVQSEELQTNFASNVKKGKDIQRNFRDKNLCKYNNNNYCSYLEKKCTGADHCISYRV